MQTSNRGAERQRLIVAARRRLARLKMASATASVVAFSGLTAAIATQVYSSPQASAAGASNATGTTATEGVIDDPGGGAGASDDAIGPGTTTPAQATTVVPAVVSAQS